MEQEHFVSKCFRWTIFSEDRPRVHGKDSYAEAPQIVNDPECRHLPTVSYVWIQANFWANQILWVSWVSSNLWRVCLIVYLYQVRASAGALPSGMDLMICWSATVFGRSESRSWQQGATLWMTTRQHISWNFTEQLLFVLVQASLHQTVPSCPLHWYRLLTVTVWVCLDEVSFQWFIMYWYIAVPHPNEALQASPGWLLGSGWRQTGIHLHRLSQRKSRRLRRPVHGTHGYS